jgi:hypothetical protein
MHVRAGRLTQILGWTAVAFSTIAASFWAFWGIIENFHEGWFYRGVWMNIAMMLAQYLMPSILFVAAALIAIRWPPIGASIHLLCAFLALWFFRHAFAVVAWIAVPLMLISIAYALGRATPRRWAVGVVMAVPFITMVVFGTEPVIRLSQRIDDSDRSARRIRQNGVDLIWAPQGPGWPDNGMTWDEAMRHSRYLTEDGRSLAATPQNIWRLPTTDEAVRSMQLHGNNSGGSWNAVRGIASYQRKPDKESPLWDVHSKVIYWWTSTEVNNEKANIIVYNGQVSSRQKRAHQGYLGFRAVKTFVPAASRGN